LPDRSARPQEDLLDIVKVGRAGASKGDPEWPTGGTQRKALVAGNQRDDAGRES
jgi:hypothetical protein